MVNFVLKVGKFGKNIFQQHFSFDCSTAINYLLQVEFLGPELLKLDPIGQKMAELW